MEDLVKAYGIDAEEFLTKALEREFSRQILLGAIKRGKSELVGNINSCEFELEINLSDYMHCMDSMKSFYLEETIRTLGKLIQYRMQKIRLDHCSE